MKKRSKVRVGDEVEVSVRPSVYVPPWCKCKSPNWSAGIVFLPHGKIYTHKRKAGEAEHYPVCNSCFQIIREIKLVKEVPRGSAQKDEDDAED